MKLPTRIQDSALHLLHGSGQLALAGNLSQPGAQPTESATTYPQDTAAANDAHVRVSRWHIVIVTHDSPRIGRLARKLERLGHDVLACRSADEVCEVNLIAKTDLVMVDGELETHRRGAVEDAVQTFRSLRPSMPLVLLAARLEADAALTALRLGFDDAITASESKDSLRGCLRRLLSDESSGRHPSVDADQRFVPGKMLAGTPYRVDRKLGEGGMGSVYAATHVTIERTVALKVLSPHLGVDQRAVASFRREARASSRIGAVNIVDVFDFLEFEDGSLVLCMEYVDGPALDEVFLQDEFDLARLIAVTRQLCKGLGAAHDAGIIHRDVKPANIMLSRRGGREDCVKILDFGIASIQAEQRGDRPLTGTPGYMAPETISREATTGKVDQYALGCLLYEWACKRLPFDGTTERILTAHVVEPPPALLDHAKREVPAGLVAIIDRCLEKNPADRFASMGDLEAALVELQLELGLRTDHDYLELPEVDPERKARLAVGLAELGAAEHGRRRGMLQIGLAAALVALAAFGTGMVVTHETPAEQVAGAASSAHVVAALEAADQRRFVLPASEGSVGDTAYAHVVALEQLGSEDALSAARKLRARFAADLREYGDLYWSYDAGRPFAEAFYTQALLFDDADDAAVARRSRTSRGEIDELERRAQHGAFTSDELEFAEPLRALAQDDPKARQDAMRRVSGAPSSSPQMVQRLRDLDREVRGIVGQPRRDDAPATGLDAEDASSDEETNSEHDASDARSRTPSRRRGRARRELSQAQDAHRAGDLAAAEQRYLRALDANPKSLEALDGLARLYFAKGSYRESLKFARMAAKRGPKAGRRWLLVGDSEFKVLHYSKAREAYERADELGVSAAKGRLAKIDAKLGG